MRIRTILMLLGMSLLMVAAVAAAQGSHPDFSGFWEPKYTGGSGVFIDVFGKVEPAPVLPGLPPLQRPRGEHPAYGAKDPVDGTACRVLAFPFFMTSSPPLDAHHIGTRSIIPPHIYGWPAASGGRNSTAACANWWSRRAATVTFSHWIA